MNMLKNSDNLEQTKNPADNDSRAGIKGTKNYSINNIIPFPEENCKNQKTRILVKCYRYGHKFIPDFIEGGGLCG